MCGGISQDKRLILIVYTCIVPYMGIFDLISPPKCLTCHKEGKFICLNCLNKVKVPMICGQNYFISLWRYEGVVRKAILALKYKFVYQIAKELGNLASEEIKKGKFPLPQKSVLTPIPLFWYRQNWRGFNQAEEIGKIISRNLGWKFVPDLLLRTKNTPSQTELGREKRQENVKDIFVFNPKYKGKKIGSLILFDDVLTTGSTLKEGVNVLKESGIKKVRGLTLAR